MINYSEIINYDCVEDYFDEVGRAPTYDIFYVIGNDGLDKIFCTGCICIVRNNGGILQIHSSIQGWLDVYMTSSYLFAEYVEIDGFVYE